MFNKLQFSNSPFSFTRLV